MGLLTDWINRRFEKRQVEKQQDYENRRMLANILLDKAKDPNMTVDQQTAIYNQIGTMLPGSSEKPAKQSKQGGGNPLTAIISAVGGLFHDDHVKNRSEAAPEPQPANPLGEIIFGDRDRRLQFGDVQKGGNALQKLMEAARQDREGAERAPVQVQGPTPGAVQTVEAPSLAVVPNKLPDYQPTARYGDLTNAELNNKYATQLFGKEQEIKARFDAENDQRTADREQKHWDTMEAIQSERTESALARLEVGEQLKAKRKMEGIRQALMAQGVNPAQAQLEAGRAVMQEIEDISGSRQASAAKNNAIANATPERLQNDRERVAQGWQSLKLRAGQVQGSATTGMSAGQKRHFDMATKAMFDELHQIDVALNNPNAFLLPERQQQMEARKGELLQGIAAASQEVRMLQAEQPTAAPSTVPRGQNSGRSARNPIGIKMN